MKRDTSVRRYRSLGLVCAAGVGTPCWLVGTAAAQVAAERADAGRPLEALPPSKTALLSQGFWLIAAVILVGVGLVLVTMLLGWRTRRLIRKPLPPTKKPDELWFLKPPHRQATAEEDSPAES